MDRRDAEQFADSYGIRYFETSSKQGVNVVEPFFEVVARCLRQQSLPKAIFSSRISFYRDPSRLESFVEQFGPCYLHFLKKTRIPHDILRIIFYLCYQLLKGEFDYDRYVPVRVCACGEEHSALLEKLDNL
eukprot:TRINITY_DN96_c0_g1_i4.p1 TRINITY_DN96_c0_g1~~TRINITY_DN96_c0_g1_i4.p1  ORF type:complete len:131 (+),score=17.47 TRINITY_DN96_c0_g1_i4:601-993(+)